MTFLIKLLLNSSAILLTGLLLPGISIEGFGTAILVSLLLGVVNTVIRPIIFVLTLPINLLTMGLFSFVTSGLMVLLVAKIVPGFAVATFLWAILFAMIISFCNWAFSRLMVRRVRY